MPTPIVTPGTLQHAAQASVKGFRSLSSDETPAAYAQAVAEHVLAQVPHEALEAQTALLKRAAMRDRDLYPRVVFSTDKRGRIAVGQGHELWGDCLAIELMIEGQPHWTALNLSPARARVLAQHLLALAEQKERGSDPGMDCIDTPAS